ncbi:MAG TPA: hypothetical protein VFL95_10570 [Gemmatimonadales bacterium]|nr:hypothetical protein [Gemmatimonadales bacterium]
MANSDYNNLRKDWIRQSRNERTDTPRQRGATGPDIDSPRSEDEALNLTKHRLGKTSKHTSGEEKETGGREDGRTDGQAD